MYNKNGLQDIDIGRQTAKNMNFSVFPEIFSFRSFFRYGDTNSNNKRPLRQLHSCRNGFLSFKDIKRVKRREKKRRKRNFEIQIFFSELQKLFDGNSGLNAI